MKKHTRATPANVPRGRSNETRRQRKGRVIVDYHNKAVTIWIPKRARHCSARPQVLE